MKDVPPAFGMTRNVMLQAVLFDLQCVVEGSIQLLNSHFYGALQNFIPLKTIKMETLFSCGGFSFINTSIPKKI